MKTRHYSFLAALLLMTAPPAVLAQTGASQTPPSEAMTQSDAKFVSDALHGGMAEVKLGQLASEKASRADVKEFGQRMVIDHGKAGAELKSLAAKKGMTIPQQLDPKSAKLYDKLSKQSGEQFDKEYIAEMVEDHKHDVAEFEGATHKLSDPELKAFAEKTLPVLKSHLQSIEAIKKAGK